MFFKTADGMRPAPLTHNPLNALVCPRPIAWVSTIDAQGRSNLAPFSYFNAVSADPPYVMFAPNAKAPGQSKDTYTNLLEVPEFVVSLVSRAHGEIMNATSRAYPRAVSEFESCGVASAASSCVRPPRVADARAALECTVFEIIALPQGGDQRASFVVIGAVVGVHIDDDLIEDGKVIETRLEPLTRLGYFNYGTLGEVIEIPRPE